MIQFHRISIRNFLSVGQVTQTIDLESADLTLILGENLDQGGSGARNGVGKSAALQALSYALFGESMNGIRKDNLINRTNGRNMLVTLEFTVDGQDYRIERGRRPNVLRLISADRTTGGVEDDAQGENRETQKFIDELTGLSADMFRIIVCLNTYTTPFLSMRASDQRAVIEQLLGITLLSEKAEVLREQIRASKEAFAQEEFRIKTITDANTRMQAQIDSLKLRQSAWRTRWTTECTDLQKKIHDLEKIDIGREIQLHADLAAWTAQKSLYQMRETVLAQSRLWHETQASDRALLVAGLAELEKIDIVRELQAHADVKVYDEAVQQAREQRALLSQWRVDLAREEKTWAQLDTEIQSLRQHRCYACNQALHDAAHLEQLARKEAELTAARRIIDNLYVQIGQAEASPVFVPSQPQPSYKTEAQALRHELDVENIRRQLAEIDAAVDPYAQQLLQLTVSELPPEPQTHYETLELAQEHQQQLVNSRQQLATRQAESDPYAEQITEMINTGIQTVDYATLNEIQLLWDHQKFLLDLLTNKDSFVRKRIIDQSLLFLNNRLTHYLEKLGLPHTVIFRNDLTVEITEWGRELDFGNLSRGESNRLIMGLSFAFRDVWCNLYHDINCLFIDEILDSGMDSQGFEAGLALLKEMSRRFNRHIFLVSHRDELIGRMPNVLKVYKTGGFTEYVNETAK